MDARRLRSSPAISALLEGAIDYAGLFPPAKLPMAAAVGNYAAYRHGSHSAWLGRFVVPVARLGEFEEAYSGLHFSEQSGWQLSVLAGTDPKADWHQINAFDARNPGPRIVSLELKPASPADVRALSVIPPTIEAWAEIPATDPFEATLEASARAKRGAKIRTGGTTADAFPPAARVAEFFACCLRLNLPAKATAGLHHPITGNYPLAYEPASPTAPMFGFVNLILAAAHLQNGGSASSAAELLANADAVNFRQQAGGLFWKNTFFSADQIRRTRQTLVRSFGSCSFVEPIEGLQSLGWL